MNLKRSLAIALSLLMILSVIPAFGAGETLDRISGANRWATAVEISQEGWDSANVVVLANGRNYPDALAGVSLAYGLDAPVLLTEADSLVAATKAEIIRLGAAKVILLGGTGVISADVADELEDMGLVVERLSGTDRFETAAKIAMEVAPAGVDTVVLASGRGFADALAAASYAAVNGYPILLTEKNSLPAATKKAVEDLGATNVIVVGGTGVIAASAVADLPGVVRVSGSNREATSVALAEHFAPQTNMFYLATGDGFADAITGAVLAAKNGTGILLVRSNFSSVTGDFFDNAEVVNAVVFGGTGVVSETVAKAAAAKLVPAGGTGVAGWVTNGAGATVSIGGKTAKVNDNGFYRVIGVAPGAYTMTITKADYAPKNVAVKVVKDNISVLNTDLGAINQTNISIMGSVVDKANGLSLDDVTISFDLWNADDNKWEEGVDGTTITDGTGVFDFTNTNEELDFGDKIRVNVSVEGYHSVSRVVTLKEFAEANVLDGFELNKIKTMVLSGKVTSGTSVIEGAEVVLYDADDNALTSDFGDDPITTDEDGLYQLPKLALPSGSYTLKVKATDYAIGTVVVNISEGVDKTQNVALAPGYNVTFTVAPTAALGETFTEGPMKATLIRNNNEYASVSIADASGATVAFAFTGKQVAPGTYTLRISGDYVKTTNFTVSVTNKDVTAYGSAAFAGHLKGNVNAKAKVELLNKSGAVVATTNANADGDYAFISLNAGEYKIRVSKEGFITETLADFVEVKVNEATPATDLILDPNPIVGEISGTIRTAGTLIPAEDAVITYYALNVKDVDAGEFVQSYTVLADGTYEFLGLDPGSYTVVIRHPGSHETLVTTQSISAGDELAKNYLLQAGGNGKINLTLTDEDDDPISTASVTLEDANGEEVTDSTDAEGKVTFAGLSAGTYTMTIEFGGYLTMEVPVTVAKGATVNRAFEMTPVGSAYTVSVGVTGVDHAALADAEILVFDADGKAVTLPATVTDGSGLASFDVVAGTYTVGIYLDGYLYAERTVTVKDAAVSMPVVILTAWE